MSKRFHYVDEIIEKIDGDEENEGRSTGTKLVGYFSLFHVFLSS